MLPKCLCLYLCVGQVQICKCWTFNLALYCFSIGNQVSHFLQTSIQDWLQNCNWVSLEMLPRPHGRRMPWQSYRPTRASAPAPRPQDASYSKDVPRSKSSSSPQNSSGSISRTKEESLWWVRRPFSTISELPLVRNSRIQYHDRLTFFSSIIPRKHKN